MNHSQQEGGGGKTKYLGVLNIRSASLRLIGIYL